MRGETEYIIDPPVYYFRGGAGFAGFAVVPTRWAKVDAEETLSEIMTQFGRFSAAPAEYLEVVADSVRTERELGAAKIGKVDVLRYRAVVDAAKAAEHESALGEEWRKYVTRGGARTVPMEAWVDDDGVLRRIRQDAQGWTTQIDLFDFGADVEVVLPPERDVTDVTDYVPGDDD